MPATIALMTGGENGIACSSHLDAASEFGYKFNFES